MTFSKAFMAGLLAALLGLSTTAIGAAAFEEALACSFSDSYPEHYVAHRVSDGDGITIDGSLAEADWQHAAWTSPFVDIADPDAVPRLETRAKMLWDDRFLYVAAVIEEPEIWANISSTCHCNASVQDQVIFHDNDFEIFVDPGGTTHGYKEFEMNAKNATWDLLLNKPYRNGGGENSSRLFGPEGFDLLDYGLQSRVVVHGAINNPAHSSLEDHWVVEVALPLEGLLVRQGSRARHPFASTDDDPVYWRINFSRVEWLVDVVDGNRYEKREGVPEDNWVWSAIGEVDMHLPERWGMLQFSPSPPKAEANSHSFVENPEWRVRQSLTSLYEAQYAFKSVHGVFSNSTLGLVPFAAKYPRGARTFLQGECELQGSIHRSSNNSFLVYVLGRDGSVLGSIDHERLLLVTQGKDHLDLHLAGSGSLLYDGVSDDRESQVLED